MTVATGDNVPAYTRRGDVPDEAFLTLYAGILLFASLALAVVMASAGHFPITDTGTLVGLCVIALLVERQSVAVADHLQMSISVLPILFAAMALGPSAGMIVGASALLLDFGRPIKRWVIWTAGRSLVAGTAGLLSMLLIGDTRASLAMLLLAALAVSAFEAVTDAALSGVTLRLRGVAGLPDTLTTLSAVLVAALPLYAPLLAVVVYGYQRAGSWAALLMLIPSLAAQRLFVMYREQRQLTAQVTEALAKLERVSLSFAAAMVAALDARDHYTAGHSATVAVYARDLARRLGLGPVEQERAHLCGLLHDVGKIGVPTELLEKRGPLSDDERRSIEMHSEIGAAILKKVEGYEEVAVAVQHHHESFDGSGYPSGLSGNDIPLLARIVAVADAYSAMNSERPYRTALTSDEARERLLAASSTQFDPVVVQGFLSVLAQSDDEYVEGTHADFELELRELASRARPELVAV